LITNHRARERYRNLIKPVLQQEEVLAHNDCDIIFRHGSNLFVSLRSTHRGQIFKLGLAGINRIRTTQIDWALSHLTSLNTADCLMHLVTHRSLWRESGDKHTGMLKRRRLERMLFNDFHFHSIIHGHNHRFVFSCTTTPKMSIPIIRLAVPTLSRRNRNWQSGYIRWDSPYNTIQYRN